MAEEHEPVAEAELPMQARAAMRKRARRVRIILVPVVIAALAFTYFVLIPYASWVLENRRVRAAAPISTCMHTLNEIAMGLRMYCTDYDGAYPLSLRQLSPRYMTEVPRCPNASSDLDVYSYQPPTVGALPDEALIRCDRHANDARAAGWAEGATVLLTSDLDVELR